MIGHRPPDDAAGEDVEDSGDVEPALPGPHVGDVGHPQLVGAIGFEVAVDEIGSRCSCLVAHRCARLSAAVNALQAVGSHEPGDALAAAAHALVAQRSVDPRGAVGLTGLGVDVSDQQHEAAVAHRSLRGLSSSSLVDA